MDGRESSSNIIVTSQGIHEIGAPPSSDVVADGAAYWWSDGTVMTGAFADGSGTPSAGVAFTETQAMTLSAVFACSRAIAENIGSLPPLVYNQLEKQRAIANRNDIPWRLLHDEPNPEMDSMVFWELMALRLENRGNAFAEIERDKYDRPIALWPIHNSRVEPYRADDGTIHWRIYSDHIDARTERFVSYTIPDRDMFNVVGFGGNGYLAPGVIMTGQEQISFGLAAHQYGSSFFKQGGRPGGVVEMPAYIDDDDRRREFRRDLNSMHATKENWHKVAVIWEGGKWKEMQYSPEQAQFIQSSGYSDKRICQFYRVPPALIQIYDDFKFNSVDAMLQSFVMTCLRPIACRFERATNRKIFKVRNGRLLEDTFNSPMIFEFLLDALLRGDSMRQAKTLEIRRRNGVINSDEWRALDNDPPLPNGQGQHYIVPGGFMRLDMMEHANQTGRSGKTKQGKTASSTAVQSVASQEQPASQVPEYSREQLIRAIESSSLLKPSGNHSRGASPDDVESIVRESAEVVIQDAIARVESVARTEMARLSKSPSEARQAKAQELRRRHLSRLTSALEPAAKILHFLDRDKSLAEVADCLASDAAVRLEGELDALLGG